MDRIICDICGSECSVTAEVCPICGYPRQGDEKAALSSGETVRGKVKGGRFSSKNVRKRLKAQQMEIQEQEPDNRGLWITIMLLVVGIVLVSVYIAMRFLGGWGDFAGETQTTTLPVTTAAPVETTVPCGGLKLDVTVVELEEAGQQATLHVKAEPENTTDTIVYASADPAVAQVSQDGVITAVGPGQTVITVTCGSVTKECSVICWFRAETTVPPETTVPTETTQPTEPARLNLDHVDASLFQAGEAFTIKVQLGDRNVSRTSVTWSTSDPEVATVKDGVVTAVGPGTATITAKYQGQKAACIVRCQFQTNTWKASATDVTLPVGDTFRLSVINGSGQKAEVVWTMDKEGIVSVEGDTVTGLAPGTVTLSATIEDVKVWCIVRVK